MNLLKNVQTLISNLSDKKITQSISHAVWSNPTVVAVEEVTKEDMDKEIMEMIHKPVSTLSWKERVKGMDKELVQRLRENNIEIKKIEITIESTREINIKELDEETQRKLNEAAKRLDQY